MTGRAGFSLLEMLIATVLTLVVAGGVLSLAAKGRATSSAGSAAVDLDQRLRAVAEALSADVSSAGSGPLSGIRGQPLGAVVPSILPFAVGHDGDPPGTVRADRICVLSAAPRAVAVLLAAPFVPASGMAQLAASPGCPQGDPACGIRADDLLLFVDDGGQADLFEVQSVAGAAAVVQPRGTMSGRVYSTGAWAVPVSLACYSLKAGPPADGTQMVTGNGGTADMPLVDHVVRFGVELLGDPQPPRMVSAGLPAARPTYGPRPPDLGVDDPRDEWPPGENCAFLVQGGSQASRLSVLAGGTDLVPLPAGILADGPWCPDQSAPNRVDADLLRVRAVRITIGLEAWLAGARGADPRLFAHPGAAVDPARWVPDRQVTFDVVPRALHAGR